MKVIFLLWSSNFISSLNSSGILTSQVISSLGSKSKTFSESSNKTLLKNSLLFIKVSSRFKGFAGRKTGLEFIIGIQNFETVESSVPNKLLASSATFVEVQISIGTPYLYSLDKEDGILEKVFGSIDNLNPSRLLWIFLSLILLRLIICLIVSSFSFVVVIKLFVSRLLVVILLLEDLTFRLIKTSSPLGSFSSGEFIFNAFPKSIIIFLLKAVPKLFTFSGVLLLLEVNTVISGFGINSVWKKGEVISNPYLSIAVIANLGLIFLNNPAGGSNFNLILPSESDCNEIESGVFPNSSK